MSLAAPIDGFRRVRLSLTERWLPGVFTAKASTVTYSLAKAGKEVEEENFDDDFKFVDVWNMWPLEFGQYKGDKCDMRRTHTVIVEVVKGQLRLLYPVNNLPRTAFQLPEDVEVFRHHHLLHLDQCVVTLTNTGTPSQLYGKKRPLCVRPRVGNVTFYLFPVVKRNKELMFKLLKGMKEEMNVELDRTRAHLKQCEQMIQPEDKAGLQMVNMLVTRLGARFLTKQMILNPIKKAFKKKMVSKLGILFKNLRLRGFQLGDLPIVTKTWKPWRDERGLWLQLSITAGCGARITMEANSLNLPTTTTTDLATESEAEQESDDSEELETGAGENLPPASAVLLAGFTLLDREMDELAFELTLDKLELEVVVNLPPPHPSSPTSLWLGLARPPPIEVEIKAGGASPRLTHLLNQVMPMVRSAILARFNVQETESPFKSPVLRVRSSLQTRLVLPHMKEVPLPNRL